jgi:hypothetical protein
MRSMTSHSFTDAEPLTIENDMSTCFTISVIIVFILVAISISNII